jgi:hypothetical protein
MESLSGPDLVKYIQKMNPGVGIEEVLEKTRAVTLQRIFVQIQKIEYGSPMHLLGDLCDMELSPEDTRVLMEWYGGKAKLLSESRSFETIYEFMSSTRKKSPSCCCWSRA